MKSVLLFCSLVSVALARDSDPSVWSVSDVAAWAAENAPTMSQDTIVEYGVDGVVLIGVLTIDDLGEEFGIESSLKRKTIMNAIEALRTAIPKGKVVVSDYWQWRSLDRQRCDRITGFLLTIPRIAVALGLVTEDDIGANTVASSVQWWISPFGSLALNNADVMGGLPMRLKVAFGGAALFEPVVIIYAVLLLLTGKQREVKSATTILFVGPIMCVPVQYVINYVFFPIIPYFLCDFATLFLGFLGWGGMIQQLLTMYNEDMKDGKMF